MADFNEWIQPPKRRYKRIFEGNNYQNIYSDAGNWTGGAVGVGTQAGTNMSISAETLSKWRGYEVTAADMQSLGVTEVLDIMKVQFWDKIRADEIRSQVIAEFTADNRSSAGYNGVKQTQKALNEIGYNVEVDGKTGDSTIQALNDANAKGKDFELYHSIRRNMQDYYKSLNKPQFLSGWINGLDRDYPERDRNDPVFNSRVKLFSFDRVLSTQHLSEDILSLAIILILLTSINKFK